MEPRFRLPLVDPTARSIDSSTVPLATRSRFKRLVNAVCGAGLAALSLSTTWAHDNEAILPPQSFTASTVPDNGDLNPYGIAFVPKGVPAWSTLKPGDIVVSNFNAKSNLQGTGTTIVKLVANGKPVTFFQGKNFGFTTALAVLRSGFVLVGNVPSNDGVTVSSDGSLLVINPQGGLVVELKDAKLLNGPWDLTVLDLGPLVKVFVAEVLSGTVSRLDLAIGPNGVKVLSSSTVIASGYQHRTDPTAFLVGPTGLAFDAHRDVLYVASTADNAIFAIDRASRMTRDGGVGSLIYQDNKHLHGPLALALAPNGHLVVSNGDAINADPQQPSEIVEFTVDGLFVAQLQIDPAPDGAFGIAFGRDRKGHLQFAAVDDNTNTATVWTLPDDEHERD